MCVYTQEEGQNNVKILFCGFLRRKGGDMIKEDGLLMNATIHQIVLLQLYIYINTYSTNAVSKAKALSSISVSLSQLIIYIWGHK